MLIIKKDLDHAIYVVDPEGAALVAGKGPWREADAGEAEDYYAFVAEDDVRTTAEYHVKAAQDAGLDVTKAVPSTPVAATPQLVGDPSDATELSSATGVSHVSSEPSTAKKSKDVADASEQGEG